MKKSITIIFLLFFSLKQSNSQDIIVLKTGLKINAKVFEIDLKEIKYKRYNFQEGPTVSVRKNDVEIIKYENGIKDVFFKKYTFNELENLYKNKIRTYKILTYFGATSTVLSLSFLTGLQTGIIKSNSTSHMLYYMYGYSFTLGSIAMFFGSKSSFERYTKKLDNISFDEKLSLNKKKESIMFN